MTTTIGKAGGRGKNCTSPTPPVQERHTTSVSSLHRFVGGITYFGSSIAMSLRASVLLASSAVPAGNLLYFSRNATMSALAAFGSEPGLLGGIEIRMRSNRSPTDVPFQLLRNSEPVSPGAKPSPASPAPWHELQSFLYASSPRVAWASVKTPLLTVFDWAVEVIDQWRQEGLGHLAEKGSFDLFPSERGGLVGGSLSDRFRRYRDELIPIANLAELLCVADQGATEDGQLLIIVETESGKMALRVDELCDQQRVVLKSLDKNYQRVEGVLGATLLGDGKVTLVLDVSGLRRLWVQSAGKVAA